MTGSQWILSISLAGLLVSGAIGCGGGATATPAVIYRPSYPPEPVEEEPTESEATAAETETSAVEDLPAVQMTAGTAAPGKPGFIKNCG